MRKLVVLSVVQREKNIARWDEIEQPISFLRKRRRKWILRDINEVKEKTASRKEEHRWIKILRRSERSSIV
jgi:hypothetical protein